MSISVENLARQIKNGLGFSQTISEEKAQAVAVELDRLDGHQDGSVDCSDEKQVTQAIQNVLGGFGYAENYLDAVQKATLSPVNQASAAVIAVPIGFALPSLLGETLTSAVIVAHKVIPFLPFITLTVASNLAQNPDMTVVDDKAFWNFYRGRPFTFEMNRVPFPKAMARNTTAPPQAKAPANSSSNGNGRIPARRTPQGRTPQGPPPNGQKLVKKIQNLLRGRSYATDRVGRQQWETTIAQLKRGNNRPEYLREVEANLRRVADENKEAPVRSIPDVLVPVHTRILRLRDKLNAMQSSFGRDDPDWARASREVKQLKDRVTSFRGGETLPKTIRSIKASLKDAAAHVKKLERQVAVEKSANSDQPATTSNRGFGVIGSPSVLLVPRFK